MCNVFRHKMLSRYNFQFICRIFSTLLCQLKVILSKVTSRLLSSSLLVASIAYWSVTESQSPEFGTAKARFRSPLRPNL